MSPSPYSYSAIEVGMSQGKGLPSRKDMYSERTPLALSFALGPAREAHRALSRPAVREGLATEAAVSHFEAPPHTRVPREASCLHLGLGSQKSSAIQFNQGPLASEQHWISRNKAAL